MYLMATYFHFFTRILLSVFMLLLQGSDLSEVEGTPFADVRCENLNDLNELEVRLPRNRSPP